MQDTYEYWQAMNPDSTRNGSSRTHFSMEENDMDFKKEFFYNLGANTRVRLQGGRILKFNADNLISNAKSRILYQTFRGELRGPETTDIPDIDYETFKLFLDCTMGFKLYTFDNALKIFQVVWKYQIQSSIDQCMRAFKYEKMISVKLCKLLNQAAFYNSDCQQLLNDTKENILSNGGYYKILEEGALYLDPCAIKLILENISVDSFVLYIIQKWADNFLKKISGSNSKKLKPFIEKNKMLEIFAIENFETSGALADFSNTKLGKEIFSPVQVLNFIHNEGLIHGRSEWKIMEKNQTFREEIVLPTMKDYCYRNYSARLQISKNKVVFYENITGNPDLVKLISLEVCFSGVNGNSDLQVFQNREKYVWFKSNFDEEVYHRFTNCNRFNDGVLYEKCVLKLTWTFLYDCRVLLVNRQGDKLNGSEKMFFSRDVKPVC